MGEFEGTARETMGIQADVEVYLVADGRSIGWKEAERLGDGKMVEVVCRMNCGGRKKNKRNRQGEKNLWNLEEGT